jgi:hypothetical protein
MRAIGCKAAANSGSSTPSGLYETPVRDDVVADAERRLDGALQEPLGAAVVARIRHELGQRCGRQLPEDADVAPQESEQLIKPRSVNHG